MKIEKIEPKGILNALTYISDNAGCGYIRSILPSEYISSIRYKQMQFNFLTSPIFIPDANWYKHFSFVKFQRSATKDQLTIIKHFHKNIKNQSNTGLIYESDDNLFNIPKSNFAHDYYMKNKPYIEEMLSLVDGITVSTGFLKKEYLKYNKNISVIKNSLCKFLWGEVKENNPEIVGKPKILYPASQNHFASVKGTKGGDIGDTLMDFIKKTVDKYEWIFVGGMPNELSDLRDNGKITYIPWMNILNYPQTIKSIEADIAIAPLEINDFNRSKSSLKMLEYTVCGLPAVYTNIEPYKFATNKADTEEYFISLIEELTSNTDMRYNSWKKDYNSVKSNLYFEDNKIDWINGHLKLFNKRLK